jgi:hypothetical protein
MAKTVFSKRRQEYQEHVGSLLYLSVYTRPDLCFAVNQLAKHMSNPGEVHWTALRRCLRYLKGTATFGITYKSDDTNPDTLTAYADADWAACTEIRRSYMGYLFMLAGGALAWKSSQYKAVTTSTAESEYVSASKASDEIVCHDGSAASSQRLEQNSALLQHFLKTIERAGCYLKILCSLEPDTSTSASCPYASV